MQRVKARLNQVEQEGRLSGYDVLVKHVSAQQIVGLRATLPLAEANARLGREQKARAFLTQMQQACRNTQYDKEGQAWLDRKTLATGLPARNCVGCHASQAAAQ